MLVLSSLLLEQLGEGGIPGRPIHMQPVEEKLPGFSTETEGVRYCRGSIGVVLILFFLGWMGLVEASAARTIIFCRTIVCACFDLARLGTELKQLLKSRRRLSTCATGEVPNMCRVRSRMLPAVAKGWAARLQYY